LDTFNGGEGLILADPATKYDVQFGLTERGGRQMQKAAEFISEYPGAAPSWIYSSNFERSKKSAFVLREELGMLFSDMRFEFSGLLDPRKVGRLERGSQREMEKVWEGDLLDATVAPPPVESSLQPSASTEATSDVARRAIEAFTRLEASYYAQDIILVSHQDTLSLFMATMIGTAPGRHHLDYPFELGQVRVLDLTGLPAEGEPSRLLFDNRGRLPGE